MTPVSRVSRRTAIDLLAVLAGSALLATAVYAASVEPEHTPQVGGNVTSCPDDTTRLKAETGDLSAGFISDDNVDITFDDVYAAGPEPADRQSAFDWTLDTPGFTILFVVVMDGEDGGNTYDYRPNGTTTDDALTTPGGEQGDFTFKNIGYVDFCYAEAPALPQPLQPLTATKTAAGTFGSMITWELTKTVTPNSHSGATGDTFSSTWTVTATKTETPAHFVVEGEITIANPNQIPVSIVIEDVLDDDTTAMVICPETGDHTGTVPAGRDLVCSYSAQPEDNSATGNTATVSSLTDGVPGATATTEVVWTETVTGDEETLLEDARFGLSETIAETTTRTFTEQFGCSDGGTFAESNTATLTGSETDLTASAQVTVECEDEIQRPSISVHDVRVTSASNGGTTVSGSFVIKNMSGGEATLVTLNQVTVTFISRRPGGIAVEHSGCSVPEANGYTLQPHEAKQFSYTCSISPAIADDATELTARVTVGTATNQLGETRGPFSSTSPSFRFGGGDG